MTQPMILVAEDGDEYVESLGRLGLDAQWLQAKSAADAVALAVAQPIACVVLDMRFDRIPRDQLAGDWAATVRLVGGNAERAWRYLAQHQGLYVLAALRAAGWRGPAIVAYDFAREARRFDVLRAQHAPLDWIGDDATASTWRHKLALACGIAAKEP